MMKSSFCFLLLCWAALATAHEAHPASPEQERARPAALSRQALGTGAAISASGQLWLAGLDQEGALFVQNSTDLGITWRDKRTLDTGTDKISADGENRPKIAFGPNNLVIIAYTKPLAGPYTGEIRMLRSADGGKHFSAPFTVHQDRQLITHRFESLAFDREGRLHTLWIDKRDQVLALRNATTSNVRRKPYAGAAIYRNVSRDGGLTFGPDLKLAEHSCECCRIALTPTADGKLAALWRHVFDPNIRDHALAILGHESPAFVRASFDEWKLDACPHHGPGLSASPAGGFHIVWFGERAGKAAVRYGRLLPDGTPVGEPRELPDSRAEHADIIASGKHVAIVWRSYDGTGSHLKAWVSADDGEHFQLRQLASSKEENDHPRLLATDKGMRAIWRTTKEIHVLPIDP